MVDLDKLNEEETAFVHKFLAHLVEHGEVWCMDFPGMDPDRFDEIAEAIMAQMNRQEMH